MRIKQSYSYEIVVQAGNRIWRYRNYSDYVRDTDEHCPWQKTKQRYQKRFPKRSKYCWICDSKRYLNLHHRTYQRLGKERLATDLVMLCSKHHTSLEGVHYLSDGFATPKNLVQLLKREKQLRRQYVFTHLRPSTTKYFILRYFYRLLP